MTNYEVMLDEGLKKLPKVTAVSERFEIPKAGGRFEGNKTVITNFSQISDIIRGDVQHFLKFLQRELATPGYIDGPRLILKRKVSSSLVNAKIKAYIEGYVLCSVCGKPDTQIIKKDDLTYLRCTACGAQREVKF